MHLVQAMAYVGDTPWHGLGNPLTPQQPLEVWAERAGMNWRIEESAVRFVSGNAGLGAIHAFPEQKVLYRSDTKAPLGTAPERVEFLAGLLFAVALEGVACFGWYLALLRRCPPMTTAVMASPTPVTTTAAAQVTLPVTAPVTATPSVADSPAPTDDLTQLAREIAAGKLRLTVADIRRHLGCSQARASGLRRALAAMTPNP